MSEQLKPLSAVLDNVLARLACVESKLGVIPPPMVAGTTAAAARVVEEESDELHPRLAAFDAHIAQSLLPFTSACTSLGPEMDKIGISIRDIWMAMRDIVQLGTIYKKPFDPDNTSSFLQPHLKPCQDAMSSIRSARIDRKFDYHVKAVMEMLASVSWVVMKAPPSPAVFVKETVGASDFWSNKIRKEYKEKGAEGENHIKFCETMKALVLDLSAHLKEHHLSGLAWNPNGQENFSAANVGGGSSSSRKSVASAAPAVVAAVATGDVFAELKKKQTGDGSSAATGLKKVSKDQQTWRKEYKKDEPPTLPVAPSGKSAASAVGTKSKSTPLGPPKCEYQERGFKWNVENQTNETCEGGVCKITVTDAKQQVYIYKCRNLTIQITGKLKSVIVDSCTKVGVVFDTAISACEIVNCKSVQVQSTNLCPSFAIDKTDGIIVHLTNEAVKESVFVTSKSSEVNGESSIIRIVFSL